MAIVAGGLQLPDGSWSFTARAAMPDHRRLADDGEEITLSEAHDARLVVLRGERVGKRQDVRRITCLAGYGFPSELEARRTALRYRTALTLACANSLTGLKWLSTRDYDWLDVSNRMRCIAEAHGSCEGEFEVRCLSRDALQTEVAQHLDRAAAVGEEIDPVFEVLMELPFDRSDRSRLLLAVSLVERSCTPPQSAKTVGRNPCRREVPSLLGKAAGRQWDKVCDLRDKIAHQSLRGDEVAHASHDAWRLAARFMLAKIGMKAVRFAA